MRDYLGGYLNQSGAIDSSMRGRMAQSGLTRRGRKRTKIIATLGPATDSEEVLSALNAAEKQLVLRRERLGGLGPSS
jgi:NH3-dependent NAD+ synthetase